MAPDNPGTPAFPLFAAMHAVPNEPFAIPRNQKSRTCGLFPLSRGTLFTFHALGIFGRFIPALAGNTRHSGANSQAASVYPRSRGEHGINACSAREYSGLSPLSRGTQSEENTKWLVRRFIPALAGNTVTDSTGTTVVSVYPRSRGEHRLGGAVAMAASRFIPALAGNTAGSGRQSNPPAVYPRSRGEHGDVVKHDVMAAGLSPLSRGTRAASSRQNGLLAVYPRSRGEHTAPSLGTR